MHARAVSVKNPHNFNFEIVLAPVVKKERLGAALALIIAGANANRINAPPILLALGMLLRIAINFARRGLKDFCSRPLSKPQHINGTMHARLRRLHGVMLIVNGRGWTGEIINLVNFHIKGEGHIVPHEFKAGIF